MPGGINDILNTTQEALDNLGVSDNLQTPSVTIATPSSPQTPNLGLYDRLLEQGSTYSALDGKDGKHQNFPMGGDQFIRGGLRAPVSAAEDVARLAKWFVNFKGGAKGPLFVAKQNLLSQTSVQTQARKSPNQGIYTPLSTLTQAGVGFLGQHVKLWDVVPGVLETKTYSEAVNINQRYRGSDDKANGNRLVDYYNKFNSPEVEFNQPLSKQSKFLDILIGKNQPTLDSYPGGPGSYLGIGKTNIHFSKDGRTGINVPTSGSKDAVIKTLNNISNYQKLTPSQKETNESKGISQRVNMGAPGKTPTYKYSQQRFDINQAVDKITALDLYNSTTATSLYKNDLVKFRIQTIPFSGSQPTFIHFRALIDSFTDNYAAGWGDTQYVGRADSLHNYESFKRDISLSFTVVAQSKAELTPMYRKLNYLASILAPSYSKSGFMRGNMVKLTLGGYLYEQPGFITSLNYAIPDTSTWEIGIDGKGGSDSSVKELPHMIKVSGFNFTPIHTFLPEIVDNISDAPDQRYIALATSPLKGGSLYDKRHNLGSSQSPIETRGLSRNTTQLTSDMTPSLISPPSTNGGIMEDTSYETFS